MRTHRASIAIGLVMILSTSSLGDVVESEGSFTSLDKRIGVERFEPKDPGKYPAILILHGAGGMEIGGPEFRSFARELARQGYVAQIVHYFDQSGTRRADTATIARSFSSWMVTVGDALTSLSKQENVDPKRVGLLGFSLGSYLSLSVAGIDPRVSAVVEYFGGLPGPFARNLKRFPPTLILHGDADKVVPVSEARKLEELFREKEFTYEIRVYPGQGHLFNSEANADAYKRAVSFLEKHVKNARAS